MVHVGMHEGLNSDVIDCDVESEDGEHRKVQVHQPTSTLRFLMDDLVVVGFYYLLVFAILLAVMLPWHFARVSGSGAITSGMRPQDGLQLGLNAYMIDPLSLSLQLRASWSLLGCLNLNAYPSFQPFFHTTYTKPLNLLYYNQQCMTNISGKSWSEVNNISLSGYLAAHPYSYGAFDLTGQPQDLELLITAVKPYTAYPFDSYVVSFVVQAYLLPQGMIVVNGTEKNTRDMTPLEWQVLCSAPPQISLSLDNEIVGFTMSLSTYPSVFGPINASTFVLELNINRSQSTVGLSMFIVVVMWLTSLGVFVLALDLSVFRNYRPVTLGSAGICATMLFALPSLRSVQPGIPPVGLYASIDIFSYFMNMGLIAFSLILILVRLTAQNKVPTKFKDTQEMTIKDKAVERHASRKATAMSMPSQLQSTRAAGSSRQSIPHPNRLTSIDDDPLNP